MLVSSAVWLGKYLQMQSSSDINNIPTHPVAITSQMTQAPNLEPVSPTPTLTSAATETAQSTDFPSQNPIGKIVFSCQIFKDPDRNQICIMNADGSDQRRLTTDDNSKHFYPSLAPDGKTLVFSSNQMGPDEIYTMDLSGHQTQLTFLGRVYAPEISPNGEYIVFSRVEPTFSSVWIMDRDGSNPHRIYGKDGFEAVDPTWSPDGQRILFAHGKGDNKKLHTVDIDGTDLQLVSENFVTRGRSDWSPDSIRIAAYTGDQWQRKVYLMNSDGSELFELFANGNVQAPTFSPDGGWLGFTGYIHNMHNSNGCEIYIMKLTDGEPQRLTNNDYCDWQPRWGP